MSESLIKIQDVSKKFGSQTVLNGISMNIHEGEIYGFLGKNGAGKSTLMKVMLGLLKSDSGSVNIFNQPLQKNRASILKNIGALIEEPAFYPNLTGEENLRVIKNLLDLPEENIFEALDTVGLRKAGNKLVKNYSLGMKQRLGIALALVKMPKILILDEPTNGLDPEGMHQMRELIKELPQKYKMTVLISSHLLSEMEQIAGTIGILNGGKLIYQGPINKLVEKRKYFIKSSNVYRTQNTLQAMGILNIKSDQQKQVTEFNLENAKDMSKVLKKLILQDIDIYSAYGAKRTLEDIFLELTGSD